MNSSDIQTAPSTDDQRTREIKRVLISILNWNSLEDTLLCLRELGIPTALGIDILVIDNGSANPPGHEIFDRFPHVEFRQNKSNLGFTGGHNIAIEIGLSRGYESVLLLNNDCVISLSDIERMWTMLMADTRTGAVSPMIYRNDADRRAIAVAGWIDWKHSICVRPSSPGTPTPPNTPTFLVGTALLLKADALHRIGSLDDRYFAYYEDNDISARLAADGWQSIYCQDTQCLHRHRSLHQYSPAALYLMSRNAWLFWTTHTPQAFRPGLSSRLVSQTLHDLALLKKNQAPVEKVNALVRGLLDGRKQRYGAPPTNMSATTWVAKALGLAPYFLSNLISHPWATLAGKF